MPTMRAARSFVIFSSGVPPMSSPPEPTGLAAPITVPGAIAATWPAMVMNVPAEAAWPPDGDT